MSDIAHTLFSEFEGATKAQWRARIERDLKGRAFNDLAWQILTSGDPLSIDPFAHADDLAGIHHEPITTQTSGNAWAIGEDIFIKNNDFKEGNQRALTALEGGANALFFHLESYPVDNQLITLLENIELNFIETHFHIQASDAMPLSFLKNFKKIVFEKEKNVEILRGSVSTDSEGISEEVLIFFKENFPLFKTITVDGIPFHKGSAGVVEELAQILFKGEKKLNALKDRGLDINFFKNNIQFKLSVGLSYFVEIAKIRALKLLWGNVLQAYNATTSVPSIQARVSAGNFEGDANTHKIKVTTQALSAVLAGVECLTIDPTEDSNFGRRISRNVQHIFQLETYLDRVADPAAGSYYIEQLTTQIAEAAWQRFQEIIYL